MATEVRRGQRNHRECVANHWTEMDWQLRWARQSIQCADDLTKWPLDALEIYDFKTDSQHSSCHSPNARVVMAGSLATALRFQELIKHDGHAGRQTSCAAKFGRCFARS